MDRVRKERDFYRRLLELAESTDLDALLRSAVELVVQATGAVRGYLEIRDEAGAPRWTTAHGFDEAGVAQVRRAISQGIVARAMATGNTVQTTSAMLDPRFSARESVVRNQIHGVLCAPFHQGTLTGAVYLESPPGPPTFQAEDILLVEMLARHLAPVANRLVARRRDDDDPTRAWRASLRCDGLVGRSPAIGRVLAEISGVARLDVTVLLTGPSGSGKNVVARLIHLNGPRSSGPFVDLNCATLDRLAESELFGVVPGAYTDAVKRSGKVEAARGGTLFLDEVGELPLSTQAKLLKLIDERTYYKVGSDVRQNAEIRLIAATNADLGEMVARKQFREDLYYRLKVVAFEMPSLAERIEDIEELAHHFLAEAARRNAVTPPHLTPGAIDALRMGEWPGNVRQLANTIEAALARAQLTNSRFMEVRHLFPERLEEPSDQGDTSLQAATRRFQRGYITQVLNEVNWNVSEAARKLGIARSHVYTLLKEYGLSRQ